MWSPKSAAHRRLPANGMLWQMLKAYANEDWERAAEPWPAPAEAFLADCGKGEALALADELTTLIGSGLDDDGWRNLLRAEEIDVDALATFGDLTDWAADLRERAIKAAT